MESVSKMETDEREASSVETQHSLPNRSCGGGKRFQNTCSGTTYKAIQVFLEALQKALLKKSVLMKA
jgi:hypothetical protein